MKNIPNPYIILCISVTVTLLIDIFRNQLSTIGDSITTKDSPLRKRLNVIGQLLVFTVVFVTVYMAPFVSYYHILKEPPITDFQLKYIITSAFMMFLCSHLLLFVQMQKRVNEVWAAVIQTDNKIDDELTKKEKKINDKLAVLDFKMEMLYKMEAAIKEGKADEIKQEIIEFAKKFPEVNGFMPDSK